jgi:hypothetical protein
MKDFAAGDKDLELGILRQRRADRRGGPDEVFEIVENQKTFGRGGRGPEGQGVKGLADR